MATPGAPDPVDAWRPEATLHALDLPLPSPRWRDGWSALVLTHMVRATLTTASAMVLWSLLPALIGWHPTLVMSGSMEPRLVSGDVVVSRPVASDQLTVGQILLVTDPDHRDRLLMHRLVAFRGEHGLVLRGDANRSDDSTPAARSSVQGVAVLRVPYVGLPMLWLTQGRVVRLLILIAATGGLLRGGCSPLPPPPAEGSDVRRLRHVLGRRTMIDLTPNRGPC